MQLALPCVAAVIFKTAVINYAILEFVQYTNPGSCTLFMRVCWVLVYPMLKFIYNGYPGKDSDHSFQLVLFCSLQICCVIKKSFPVIHAEQLHSHARYFCNFHGVFFKAIEL